MLISEIVETIIRVKNSCRDSGNEFLVEKCDDILEKILDGIDKEIDKELEANG